jgi:hypothetical protein
MTIDQLRLSPNARHAAEIVQARHPTVIFTSGRRDVRDQARVMAENTIRYGVGWLGETYKNREMVESLEQWMEQNLDKTASVPQMTDGFVFCLTRMPIVQFPHCRGDAFDIQCPRFADGRVDEQATSAIRHTIETLPIGLGLQLILTKEGQHRVIHAQFNHVTEPVEV